MADGGQRPARTGRPGLAKAIAFALLPGLVLFSALEGGLRLRERAQIRKEQGRKLPTPRQRHAYQIPEPELGYALRPGYDEGGIRVNRLGYRGPEIEARKPDGTVRIVALGDSCTFGLSGHGCPYPAQLQAILNDRADGVRYEVVNGGVEGYTSRFVLRLVETRLSRIAPDLALVYVGWNDLYGTDPFESDALMPEPLTGPLGGTLLERSAVYRWTARLLLLELPRRVVAARAGGTSDAVARIHPEGTAGFRDRLARIVAALRNVGALPVLMTLPVVLSDPPTEHALSVAHYPRWAAADPRLLLAVVDRYNETIRKVGEAASVPVVELAAHLAAVPDGDRLFFDTLHLHCEGYGLIAERIAERLEEAGLLPASGRREARAPGA